MINKILKQGLWTIYLLLLVSLASAANMTIDELIASYDYDFNDGTLNITATDDYMLDIDSNSLNDTLIINLTSNATSGTYMAYVDLDDPNGKIIEGVNKTLSASDMNFVINFSTSLISQNRYNYTIRIEDSSDILIYEEHSIETNTYTGYEQGTNITLITDENLSNNHIQINLTLNVTVNETVNITVAMQYNDSYISSTEEKTLIIGIQTVSIKFDNETIKGTHYNGNFTVDSITIGDKIIDKNQTTAIYDYETFAKTSYIKDYSNVLIDTNNDNLSEFLEINFTLNIKTAGSFNLEAELYDEFNNYISSINETETLSTGEQIISARINGSDIYKTKINGPYLVSFAKLSLSSTLKDVVYDAYTTNVTYYTDFERPPLSDLVITMNVSYSGLTNITNITINISNNGQATAFNVFMDLFDNRTNSSFTRNESEAFLDVEQSVSYNYTISNTTNGTLYTAIADFDNYVDESNESNNIVQNTVVSLTISSLSALDTQNTKKIFEFIILNDGDFTVTDIWWTFSPGEGYQINSTYNISSLDVGEQVFVYIEYNYSSDGSYTATANATGLSQSGIITAYSSSSVTITTGNIDVFDLKELYSEKTVRIFGFKVNNTGSTNLTDINWTLDTGLTTVVANQLTNLSSGETIFVFVEYNYTQTGDYIVTASATDGTNIDSETMSIDVEEIELTNLTVLNSSDTKRIFEFIIENTLTVNLSKVNWTLDTGLTTIVANQLTNLISNEELYVYVDYNYTQSGTYNVNATAINGSLIDSRNITISVP